MGKKGHVKGMVRGAGKDANSGLSKKSEKPAPTLPLFQFIDGVAYWQLPTDEHFAVLEEAALRCKWDLENQGVVEATGKVRYKITHRWLRAQFNLEQKAREEERAQLEMEKAAMNSLPHLIFKGNICAVALETEQQEQGLALKAERLNWEYEKLPDGTFRIAKMRAKKTG